MLFPVLAVHDGFPTLVLSPAWFGEDDTDNVQLYLALKNLPGLGDCLYMRDGSCGYATVTCTPEPTFWTKLAHGKDRGFWQVRIALTDVHPYALDGLREKIMATVRSDDDVLTQFHEADVIAEVLGQCTTYAQLPAAMCLLRCYTCGSDSAAALAAIAARTTFRPRHVFNR